MTVPADPHPAIVHPAIVHTQQLRTSSTRRSLKRSVTSILISFSSARLKTSCKQSDHATSATGSYKIDNAYYIGPVAHNLTQ